MKFTKNIGMLLLSIWLIATGLMILGSSSCRFPVRTSLRAILAIAAGVFILIGPKNRLPLAAGLNRKR